MSSLAHRWSCSGLYACQPLDGSPRRKPVSAPAPAGTLGSSSATSSLATPSLLWASGRLGENHRHAVGTHRRNALKNSREPPIISLPGQHPLFSKVARG